MPKERLLEWEVQDGWRPLCALLGVDEPEGAFPHVNDSKGAGGLAWCYAGLDGF